MGASWSDDRWNADAAETIRVLHLDDEASITDLTATFLEKEYEYLDVVTANDEEEAIELFEEAAFDCVVSDYDMNEMTGLEFLDAIRERDQDLPFILFTGKGSEEIASEAISRGVTDYLQKTTGTNQYRVLANRITNVVDQYRTKQQVEMASRWYGSILENSSDYVMIVDDSGTIDYVSPAITRVMGYDPEEIVGTNAFDFIYPEDLNHAVDALANTMQDPDRQVAVQFRAEDADGNVRWLEARGRDFLDDPIIDGVMVNVRDVTDRMEREQALEAQTALLGDLTGFLSHDVQTQLHVLEERIELAGDECDSDHLGAAGEKIDRIDEMLDKVMQLARSEQRIAEKYPVEVADVVEACWQSIGAADGDATLTVETDSTVLADEERLRSLFENLFRNASTYAGSDVSVRVGDLEGQPGFFVADDGPGIPPDDRDEVFDVGFSSDETGTGIGLAIVDQIATAHGWDVRATESRDGGARFEFTGVERE